MIKTSRSQLGFAHAFLIIGLVVALIGALGFIFWQNFINKEPTVTKTDKVIVSKNQTKSEVKTEPNKGLVVLSDWGVMFKPSTQTVVYEKQNNTYTLTTKRVQDLGGRCTAAALIIIERHKDYRKDFVSAFPLNNNEAIDGYYYTASGANQYCSDSQIEIQTKDQNDLADLVKKLEKSQ